MTIEPARLRGYIWASAHQRYGSLKLQACGFRPVFTRRKWSEGTLTWIYDHGFSESMGLRSQVYFTSTNVLAYVINEC
jgi:hypothetical protein